MKFILYVLLSLIVGIDVLAETIVKRRLSELPQLHPLQKLTVGPDDNYQVDITVEEDLMVFTRKSHLSTRLYLQPTTSSEERPLLDKTADASSAVFHPNGKALAFVYYKKASRGDLCLLESITKTGEPKCFQLNAEIESPQWLDPDHLIYSSKEFADDNASLFKLNVHNRAQTLIDKGMIWSPAASLGGGNYLAYNKKIDEEVKLVVVDLQQNKSVFLKIDLPGISGFPEFSSDGQWLYFSQYFSDSNEDQKIDGNDNSVIFRVNTQQIFANSLVVPQQLTSGEENCSFPRVRKNYLFVTCDFEGSLDVYKLPITGVVPVHWDVDILRSAHRSSRNYNQRILLLNHLLYKNAIRSGTEYSLKLFSNFLLNEDLVAAKYYILNVKRTAAQRERKMWSDVEIFLEAKIFQKKQNSNVVNAEFARQINQYVVRLKKSRSSVAEILEALLYTFTQNFYPAVKIAKRLGPKDMNGVNPYFYYDLIQILLQQKKHSLKESYNYYSTLLKGKGLSKESKIYYTYKYLGYLQNHYSVTQRLSAMDTTLMELNQSADLQTLLSSEQVILQIILAKEQKTKDEIYPELDKLMSQTRHDYFLRKALYVRAIDNFIEHEETQFATYVATTWLKYTKKSDTEFKYAREVYIDKILARAYKKMSEGEHFQAANNFYGSLSLTDDLESHYGYVVTMNKSGKGDLLGTRYDNLVKREFINENIHYVNAVRELTTKVYKEGHLSEQKKSYQKMIEELNPMSGAYTSPVYHLLLGYLHLKLTELSVDRFAVDQKSSHLSHKHLMLAYDLGRFNVRIKASALSNLAFLHFHSQNWGLARRFFELRKPLGFIDAQQEWAHLWFQGKVLYNLGDYLEAIALSARMLNLPVSNEELKAMVQQRMAFYQLGQGLFIEAEQNFAKSLKMYPKQNLWNLVKSELGLGYARYKIFQEEVVKKKSLNLSVLKSEAEQNFINVIERSKALTTIRAEGKYKTAQMPLRLTYLAQGFLAQLQESPKKIRTQIEFQRTLLDMEPHLSDLAIDLKNWQAQKVKTSLQLASLHLNEKHNSQAKKYLLEAFDFLKAYVNDQGLVYSHDLHEALLSWSGLAIRLNEASKLPAAKEVHSYIHKVLVEVKKIKSEAPAIVYQNLRLKAFQFLLETKLLKQPSSFTKNSILDEIDRLPEPWKAKSVRLQTILKGN